MRVLNEKDYRLIERLVSLNQKELKRAMEEYIRSKYKNTIITKEYIVGIGDIPIALVAHMDTVFKKPVSELYYDQRKGVLWSPDGLGADDRAGVFAILKILQDGFRPSVILTTDEEIGGIGAAALAAKKCPIPDLKYMIQLDRRGTNDCVFYDCYNPSFIDYIEKFGFCERWGSFSDISFLMPEWNICGVNLSVGYENEHSYSETLSIKPLFDTIRKVKNMLMDKNIPNFEYSEIPYYDENSAWYGYGCGTGVKYTTNFSHKKICYKCKKPFSEYEIFPAKGVNGKTKYFCPDCVVGNVEWCEYCGEAFEVHDPANITYCKDCMEDLCTKTSKDNLPK